MTNINLDLTNTLDLHGKWLRGEKGGVRINFEGANLEGANLEGANLSWANLRRANLEGADLRGSNLKVANLEGANPRGANLEVADLRGANLRGANLEGANLAGVNLRGANLEGANLSWANLEGAVGNMREVVSAHVETWPITAARMLDGSVVMQIGCQRHPLDLWRKADTHWIAAMDRQATAWWDKWGDFALAIGASLERRDR